MECRIVGPSDEVHVMRSRDETEDDAAGTPVGMSGRRQDLTGGTEAHAPAGELNPDQVARAEADTAVRRLAFLAEASAALGASLDLDATLRNVARLAVPMLGDWIAVHLVEADGTIRRVALESADPARLQLARELRERYPVLRAGGDYGVARAIRTGATQLAVDVSDYELAASAWDGDNLRLLRALGLRSYVIAPLTAAGRVFGALACAHAESGRTYTPAYVTLVEELARRGGTAIHSALLVRERERTQRSLRESEARLSAFLEQLPLGVGMFDTEGRWIIRNRALERMIPGRLPSRDPHETPRWRTWAADGSLVDPSQWPGARALRGEVVSPGMDFLHTLDDGPQNWMRLSAAPFRDESGAIIGAIFVVEDIDERKRAAARLEAVARITQALLRHTTLDDVLNDLLDRVREALHVDEGTILLACGDGMSLNVRAARGIEHLAARNVRIPFGRGVAGHVAATRQPVLIPDLSQVEVFRPALREALRSLLAVPLLIDHRVIGVLHVGTGVRRDFSPEDRAFLELVAERVVSIIERARLHEGERTARAEAEAARQKAESARLAAETANDQLGLALEAGRMGTWQYEPGSGRVTWSPGLEAIHGFTPGTFPGTFEAILEEIHAEDRARVLQAIETAIAERRDHHIEYRIIRSDGAVRWVEGRGQLFLDDEGGPARMTGVCLDVTERKKAEEKFRLAVEAAPAAMLAVDTRGAIVMANRLAEQLFGYSGVELVGLPIDRLVPPRFRSRHAEYRRGYFAESAPRPMGAGRDLYALRKDDSEVQVEIGLSPIETADGTLILAGITDITERVRLHEAERAAHAEAETARQAAEAARREAEAANRAKAAFLAAMSHDLRTPLNAIAGYSQLLEMEVQGPLTDRQRDALARIAQNQQRVAGMLDELLRFARIEAQGVEYRMKDVVLEPLLAALEVTVAPQIREKRLVYTNLPCDADVVVHADREKVEQVLLNLLTNAVKFTEPGGRITLDVEPADDRVAIHVRDTGRGIAAAELARIFEPFVQVGSPLDGDREGVGLGLAVSRQFARGMGGDVTVDSMPGQGSTFTLWVSRSHAPPPPA
jgi:PAS domain S-box-containing protein